MPFFMLKKGLSVKKSSRPKYRFLLNANLSRKIIPPLSRKFNFDFIHISDVTQKVATDREIIDLAKKDNRIIITHDLDYGEIYYLQEQGKIGVIMLRLKNQTSVNVLQTLSDFFSNYKSMDKPLSTSLIIISDEKIRIFSV